MIDMNSLRELLVALAAKNGVPRHKMEDSWNDEKGDLDWQLNYKKDLNVRLEKDLHSLVGFAGVCEMAKRDGDLVAMNVALSKMRLYAMNVASEFDALAEDVTHIIRLEGKAPGGPELPERYVYADRYRKAFPDLHFDA